MSYELWDLDSGNRLGMFRTKRSAQTSVQAILDKFGPPGLDGLSVGRFDAATKTTSRVATGRALARWAATAPASPGSAHVRGVRTANAGRVRSEEPV
jgi:hypothetical protein